MSDEGRFSFFAATRWHRFVAGHAPLGPPERLVRLAKRLLPRYANVLEQVDIVLLGDFPQRPALTRARDPSTDRRTQGGDRAFRLGSAVRHDAGGSQRALDPLGQGTMTRALSVAAPAWVHLSHCRAFP